MLGTKSMVVVHCAVVAMLMVVRDVFAQCPMCKTGLMNSSEGRQMADGFNSGILFLLTVPLMIFAAMAVAIARAHRRQTSGDNTNK
jgi:hypothetical protein